MAKDEIRDEVIDLANKKKKCSICRKEILQGQFYVRDVITNDIVCSSCDNGHVPIKGDNLVSID